MKSLVAALWRWSWVVTLPICTFFAVWGMNTAHTYREFGLRYDPTPMQVELWQVGHDEFHQLRRRLRLAFFPEGGRGADHADDLRTISLYVKEKRLARLNSDLPYSGFEYVKGGIWDGTGVRDVKVRYRGDYARHWAFAKKSLRVKTDTDALFEGMRSFNLIVPKFEEHLNNFLAYRLAGRLGLLVPRTELVHVAINGKRRGVHVLVEQLEELTLRANGFMPGDIYSGDLVAKDSSRGITNWVFDHPGQWEKIAINNHYPEEHREPLERLLVLLNEFSGEERSQELMGMLDLDAWARFSAFESLARTFHYDLAHNWRLYYDLNRGKFVPVVWDPVGWAKSFRLKPGARDGLDVVVTRMHQALFENGDFLRARHRVLRNFFATGEASAFLSEVGETIARMDSAIAVDPNLLPPSEATVSEEMRELRLQINQVFGLVEQAHVSDPGAVRWRPLGQDGGGLALSVAGEAPVERILVSYDQPLTEPTAVTLRCYRRGATVDLDVTGAVRVDGHRLEVELGLLARRLHSMARTTAVVLSHRVETGRGYYELHFEGLPEGALPIEVLADNGGPALLGAERVGSLRPLDLGRLYSVVPERLRYTPVFWSGTVEVEGVLEIDEDLVIAAGCEVRLHPGASLVARGRVLAEGTARNPIRFVPASADPGAAPWGTVALQGSGTSGSRFAHCQFSAGSGLKDGLREYSAMFSVHDAHGVRIESCAFADGSVVDDMVHAVYAEIAFVDCTFQRSLSDALDLDICRARIQGCVFEASGNDAIDLMTTQAVVWDTVLLGNGDKGISTGEGSALFAVNNEFVGNAIGIQVKDSSEATVLNSTFRGNALAVDAYKKNWRYGDGGHVRIEKSRFESNERGLTADKHSSVSLRDCFVDRMPEVDSKGRVVLEASVDADEPELARETMQRDRIEEHLTGLGNQVREAWKRADETRRGAALDDR